MLTNSKIEIPFDIFIDACTIYPPLQEEKEAIAEILELEHTHKVHLVLTEENTEELRKISNDPRIESFLRGRIFWKRVAPNVNVEREIKQIMLSNKKSEPNENKDIKSLATAVHYHCKHYITMDKKHIWNNRDIIRLKFNIEIRLPSEFLSYAKERLNYLEEREKKKQERILLRR